MKGIKKIFMLATMLCVVFMCVGCVKPTKQEHDISMDDNEKGTYTIKYTFSKSTFENTTYGTYSSYETYVSDLENLVSQDVNMDLSVDSKSSTKNLFVTVEIDFSSLKDLNAKLNKVYAKSNNVYNANVQEDKEINEYKLINNACANDNLDTVLQEELYNNGIEFDVNSEQYKVLNYAFTTGEKVYSLADVERVKSLVNFYKYAYRFVGIFILVIGCCLIPILPMLVNFETQTTENLYVVYIVFFTSFSFGENILNGTIAPRELISIFLSTVFLTNDFLLLS